MFRRKGPEIEVLLVHPGGPYWAKKDQGAWTIPKGEYPDAEDPLSAARREFEEETGFAPLGDLIPLTEVKQAGGKVVRAWAVEGDLDASAVRSNTFTMEWPPGSGRMRQFREVDRAEWFPIDAARAKINKAQIRLLAELISKLS